METLDLERLGELCFDVAESWKKQQMYAFDKSGMMYDTDLYECQNEETALKPSFKNNRAIWDARITTNCGNDWQQAYLSIPKWLYVNYMTRKANFISWRLVESTATYQDI